MEQLIFITDISSLPNVVSKDFFYALQEEKTYSLPPPQVLFPYKAEWPQLCTVGDKVCVCRLKICKPAKLILL